MRVMRTLIGNIQNSFELIFRMVFFLATLVTAAVFITDRTEGIWERTLVAGNESHFPPQKNPF